MIESTILNCLIRFIINEKDDIHQLGSDSGGNQNLKNVKQCSSKLLINFILGERDIY